MISDENINRVIRRHMRFKGYQSINPHTQTMIRDIVKSCIKINNLEKGDRDKYTKVLKKSME